MPGAERECQGLQFGYLTASDIECLTRHIAGSFRSKEGSGAAYILRGAYAAEGNRGDGSVEGLFRGDVIGSGFAGVAAEIQLGEDLAGAERVGADAFGAIFDGDVF